LWHFQTVHHDTWDYDLTTGPKLLTVRHNGKPVDIVAQATKTGFVFVFDRVTGAPLWPIEERPVPPSDVRGERLSPTQPYPTKPPPFARQEVGLEDLNPYLDEAEYERVRDAIRNARNEGLFTPQTLSREQLSTPGEFGGSNWGGAAGDPSTGWLYVRSTDTPALHKLRVPGVWVPAFSSGVGNTPAARGRAVYQNYCEACHGQPTGNGIQAYGGSGLINVAASAPIASRRPSGTVRARCPQQRSNDHQRADGLAAHLYHRPCRGQRWRNCPVSTSRRGATYSNAAIYRRSHPLYWSARINVSRQ
jgi:hypothetical protein